jgi:two-component sensor histidine kinase
MDRWIELLPERKPPAPARYGLTALIMLTCGLLQLGLQTQAGFTGLFLLMPGVFISGLLFDRGSGLLAAAISIMLSIILVASRVEAADYVLPLTLFAITTVGVAVVAEALRNVIERLVKAERSKSTLLQELAHRTKNNLAILGAMVRLQAKGKEPAVTEALDNTFRRITVLAEMYDHLTLRADTKLVDAREYFEQLFNKIQSVLEPATPIAITTESDEYYLPSAQAVALAIIANELVTNAYKYAFRDGRAGRIHIALKVRDAIELSVTDNGIGLKEGQTPRGFGSRIVALLTQELNGSLSYRRLDHGCRVVLRVPADGAAKNAMQRRQTERSCE